MQSSLNWFAVVLSMCANVALAQTILNSQTDGNIAQTAASTLPTMTVTGHYDNGVGTSGAASQGTVRGELLQDIPLLRPGEALETVPGLVVTQHSGDGKANQYFLRGYNLDHGTDFATSVDGVPVNLPTNAHGQGYSDLNFMIPELIDTIDYRKGPYFAANGDFSSAGSDDVHYRNNLDRNIADLTVGSFGYHRVLLAGSTQLNATSISAGGRPILLGAIETMGENGPWTVPEDLRKLNGLLRLSDGSRSKGWSMDANVYDAHWNSTDQVPLAMINSGQLGLFSALDPTDGGETGRINLAGEWHLTDSDGYARASAYMQHYRLQLWSDFTFYAYRNPLLGCAQIGTNLGVTLPSKCPLAPNANSPTDQFSQYENRNFLGGQVVRGWSQSLFGHDSVTEIGLQLRHDNINVGLLDTQSRVTFATVSNDNVNETETGLHLQNITTWNSWLSTLVGLREDHVTMDMISYVTPANSGSVSQSQLSPKFSAIFGPWSKTEFFFNVGKGFHSNDARGVIDKIDPTTGQAATPVPALVGSLGKEIGMRTEAISGLQSSMALWSLHSNSELIYNADSDIGSTTPNGASNRYGVEWNNHMIPNGWLLLDADLAWTHARYSMMNDNGLTGDLIPNAVSKVAVLRETVHEFGPWSAGIETRYIGQYPLTQDGTLTAPSAIATNLRLLRKLTPDMGLSLDVLNVFNRKYFDIAYQQDYQASATGAYVPNSANGETVHPGEPLEFRVTLRLKF
jgi:hypothetical protein